MSQIVQPAKQPLISSELDDAADESDQAEASNAPQRKCGVHRLAEDQHKVKVTKKKRSVDAVVEAYLDEHPAFLDDYVSHFKMYYLVADL